MTPCQINWKKQMTRPITLPCVILGYFLCSFAVLKCAAADIRSQLASVSPLCLVRGNVVLRGDLVNGSKRVCQANRSKSLVFLLNSYIFAISDRLG